MNYELTVNLIGLLITLCLCAVIGILVAWAFVLICNRIDTKKEMGNVRNKS